MQPESDSSVFSKTGHLCLRGNEKRVGVVSLEIHPFNKHLGSNYCVSETGLGTNSERGPQEAGNNHLPKNVS